MKKRIHSNRSFFVLVLAMSITLCACTTRSDGDHTTATSYVSPPPHQVLTLVSPPSPSAIRSSMQSADPSASPKEPLLIFNLKNGATFRVGQPIPIDFAVLNAKLKGEGGDSRVRYIVDDGEMQWLDDSKPIWLSGWVPGEHMIRIELIGPDGWPYRNGNANVVTRKFQVTD